ncbi:MAG TPA: glucose-6-phosphate dehydrogenase assembly protein OpcA [Chthoniobacterales bacterium]|nr:glucose-6-phosphate dehydrogenase assembly protein OpcA [Chthoniobacterales bacterium]
MPATTENYSLGLQVEVGKIDQELKKLWQQGEGAMTRASLINLAVYSEAPGSLEKNTQLVAKIAENLACRAIVIGADCQATQSRVEAWISAHCHVSRVGSEQICSEQLSFRLEGSCAQLLPSIVFSHLDSDLPFYLWWQGELHDPMDPQLWAWVDRFIYDSHEWKNFDSQMRLVETAQNEAKQRIVLCDLNWTRLDRIRYAIAQFFDHPASHHHFAEVENAQIDFAPSYRSTAALLAGWLGAQLNWKIENVKRDNHLSFVSAAGRKIDIELRENGEAPVGKVVLNSGGIEFVVAEARCGDLLEVWRRGPNEKPVPQMMPAQSDDPVELMSQELMRGGAHQVYLRAVNCVRELL